MNTVKIKFKKDVVNGKVSFAQQDDEGLLKIAHDKLMALTLHNSFWFEVKLDDFILLENLVGIQS